MRQRKSDKKRERERQRDWHGNRGCWALGAVVITRATNKSRQLKTEQSTYTYTCSFREEGEFGVGGEKKVGLVKNKVQCRVLGPVESCFWRATRVCKYLKSNKNRREQSRTNSQYAYVKRNVEHLLQRAKYRQKDIWKVCVLATLV